MLDYLRKMIELKKASTDELLKVIDNYILFTKNTTDVIKTQSIPSFPSPVKDYFYKNR